MNKQQIQDFDDLKAKVKKLEGQIDKLVSKVWDLNDGAEIVVPQGNPIFGKVRKFRMDEILTLLLKYLKLSIVYEPETTFLQEVDE